MYDAMETGYLDIFVLRHLFKKTFVSQINILDQAMKDVKNYVVRQDAYGQELNPNDGTMQIYEKYINWDIFVNCTQSFGQLLQALSIAFDRMEI